MITKSQSLLASLFLPFVALGTLLLVFVLYLPTQAKSGTYIVNTTADTNDGTCNAAHCTLREAILAANASAEADTITFSLPPSATITLNGTQLPIITGTLTIDGSTAANLTISGDNASRVMVIGTSPPPYPVASEHSTKDELGSSATVTLTNLTITDGNEPFHLGGGIFNNGTLTILDSTISNTTSKHGAVYNSHTLVISNSIFISNTVVETYGAGAGIYNTDTGVATITNSAFLSNTVTADEARGGGGIYNRGGKVTISGSVFSGNYGNWFGGGAIGSFLDGRVNVSDSTFTNNSTSTAFGSGGGAINALSALTITNSTFSSNVAGNGGAVRSFSTSDNLLILNSTFANNTAGSDGGALLIEITANVANNTFSNNTAQRGGGIMISDFVGDLTMNNNTITGNSATSTGGGVYNLRILNMSNNIIANSLNGADCFSTTPIDTNVNNLIEDGSCNAPLSGDPLLGPLQDNGGDTRTHTLLFGSPAIDAGHSATCAAPPVSNLDQRGEIRPVDGNGDGVAICDIGAYEAELLDFGLLKNGPALAASGEFITYTLTAANNLTTTVTNVVLTDTIPTNATYISGGTLVGNVVSWTLPSLAPGETFTRFFVVTATQTITNHDYQISADGGYSTTSNVPVVTVVAEPITGLAATNDSPTIVGNVTSLMATITTGSDVNYTWAFGDGEMGSGNNPAHTYPDAGVYIAVVTVTNPIDTLTATTVVTINDAPITGLSASNDSPNTIGNLTTLMASVTSGSNINYIWAFGDGTTGSGANTIHMYPDAGVYTAVVTATNPVNTLTATTVVTITDFHITGLSASNNSPTNLGNPTTLMATIATGTNINYTWAFGDGTTGSGQNPSHIYPDVGTYTAVVTATNSVSTVTATTLITIEQDTWTIYLPVVLDQDGNAKQAAQPPPLSLKRYWR